MVVCGQTACDFPLCRVAGSTEKGDAVCIRQACEDCGEAHEGRGCDGAVVAGYDQCVAFSTAPEGVA